MTEICDILREHACRYPLMEPTDALKLLYQNEFCGGHLIQDENACLARLRAEYATVRHDRTMPLTEDIGNGIVRVNLAALPPEKLDALGDAFLRSSVEHRGSMAAFLETLNAVAERFAFIGFPFAKTNFFTYLDEYRKAGYPAVSHSDAYRAAYHPAYRVVLTNYTDGLKT